MLPADRRAALRYMGWRGAPDAQMEALLTQAEEALRPALLPRSRVLRLPLTRADGALLLDGLALPGESIRAHLDGCDEALLLCATLGAEVDRLLRREMLLRPALALAINGCATAALERFLDDLCAETAAPLSEEGLYLTPRFSPGYGDLPLTLQHPLLSRLEAGRIGLTATQACQLQPEKSVTALCGLTRSPARRCCRKCAACPNKDCLFREE